MKIIGLQLTGLLLLCFSLAQGQWSATTALDFYSVDFANANIGYAVGTNGLIMKTGNGGASWVQLTNDNQNTLYAVYFSNPDTGWAGGTQGTILQTTDGGTAWDIQASNTSMDINEIFFIDSQHGWAIWGNGGGLQRTTNGGGTWVTINTEVGWWLKSITFVNPDTGWLSGDGPTIMGTIDGGQTWTNEQTGLPSGSLTLTGIFFTDENHGWAVGGNYDGYNGYPAENAIVRTIDAGNTWTRVKPPDTTHHMSKVRFVSTNLGWAVGWDGLILNSTDGGQSWDTQAMSYQTNSSALKVSRQDNLYAVDFINSANGWAVGQGTTIVSTANGGGITSAIGSKSRLPTTITVSQNYPNPFNPTTTIRYQLPARASVRLSVYNSIGQRVTILYQGEEGAGMHALTWNGRGEDGQSVASGVYFYQLEANGTVVSKKMLLLK